MTPVRVRPEAQLEAEDAALYYELQSPGLGYDFFLELDETLERISSHAEGYQVLYRGVRRASLHRFPYGVFYFVEDGIAVVFAVLHMSRDPETWKTRVPKR